LVLPQDFVDAQREHQGQVEQVLAEFHSHALATVLGACQADLETLEERLQVTKTLKNSKNPKKTENRKP
jgi:hypothetical protein